MVTPKTVDKFKFERALEAVSELLGHDNPYTRSLGLNENQTHGAGVAITAVAQLLLPLKDLDHTISHEDIEALPALIKKAAQEAESPKLMNPEVQAAIMTVITKVFEDTPRLKPQEIPKHRGIRALGYELLDLFRENRELDLSQYDAEAKKVAVCLTKPQAVGR